MINYRSKLDGIDFFYANQQDARKLVDFFMAAVPSRYDTSKRLISHDIHSNTYNYKYTYSIEIVPICKVMTNTLLSVYLLIQKCNACALKG